MRFQIAAPTVAAATESAIPSGTEIASSAAWPGGTTVQTASAGRTTTNAVAITTCGSHRSMPAARRLWRTRTAIRLGIG